MRSLARRKTARHGSPARLGEDLRHVSVLHALRLSDRYGIENNGRQVGLIGEISFGVDVFRCRSDRSSHPVREVPTPPSSEFLDRQRVLGYQWPHSQSRGFMLLDPWRLLVILSLLTAACSAAAPTTGGPGASSERADSRNASGRTLVLATKVEP